MEHPRMGMAVNGPSPSGLILIHKVFVKLFQARISCRRGGFGDRLLGRAVLVRGLHLADSVLGTGAGVSSAASSDASTNLLDRLMYNDEPSGRGWGWRRHPQSGDAQRSSVQRAGPLQRASPGSLVCCVADQRASAWTQPRIDLFTVRQSRSQSNVGMRSLSASSKYDSPYSTWARSAMSYLRR